MSITKFAKQQLAVVAAALWLAGCASVPAPVANYSFGGSGASPAAASSTATPVATGQTGAQTFGLGSHANGSIGPGGYVVAPGDTLYSIAFANGMDVRQLAALNGLAAPYVIHPGQVLKLTGGAAGAVAAAPATLPASTTPPALQSPPAAPVFGPVTTQAMTANGVAPTPSASIAGASQSAASAAVPPATAVPPPVAQPANAMPTPPAGATRNVAGIAWRWPASGKVIGGFKAGSGGDGAGLDIAGNMGDPVRAAAAGTVVYSGNGLIGYGELVIIKHNDTYLSAYGHNSKRLVKEGDHVSAGQEIALMGASGAPRVELHFEIRKDGKPVDPLAYLPAK